MDIKIVEYNRIKNYKKYDIKSFFDKLDESDFSGYIYSWTGGYRYLTNLFLAIDKNDNIVGYMFLDRFKKSDNNVKIKLIDTFIRNNNIALKMILLFENKTKKTLYPEKIIDEAKEYWKKLNKPIIIVQGLIYSLIH